MGTFGRTSILTVGRSIKVTADGRPLMKQGGITVDWSTVAAISGSDVVYEDGVTVAVGEKALRYGQVLSKITASGKYGPYDPLASDGRQTAPAIGSSFIVLETTKQTDLKSDHPPVLYGGLCYLARIIQSGVGAHSLAAGPTLAELLAAFPQLQPVTESP